MKNFQITARKILMFLSILVALIPCTLLLTACGGSSGNQTQEKQFSWAECYIANNGNYAVTNDYQITISKDVDIHDIISADSFIVTLHYTDDSTEVITSGFTFEILDVESEYYPYSIEVKYQDNLIASFSVAVDTDALPLFVNIEALGDMYSGYRCTEELRYTGEEYDITKFIKTSDNVTLAQMISNGIVTVDTEIYGDETGAIRATEANTCYGSDYGAYGFNVHATTGYKWFINGQPVENIEILWTIKRAIIETPTLTSGTNFVYQHEWNGEKYVGVEQGLTFDYGDGAEYIEPAEKHADAGWYQTILNIKNEYENRYAFLINGAEQTYLNYDWSIEAMRLAEPTMISENNDNHFIYTGENIFPTLTSDYLALFAVAYPESAVDVLNWGAYQINVDLKSEYDNIYTSNYNFQGTTLDYYIDPAPFDTNIKNEIDGVDFVIEKTYYPDVNYVYYFDTMSSGTETLSNDAADIAKLQYNESSLIAYELADGYNWNNETLLNAGTYADAVKVTYQHDRNHEAYEFNAKLTILPVGIELNNNWSLWVYSTELSGEVNDNAVLTYSEDTTYTCNLWNTNDDIQITYTNRYGVNENSYTTTKDTIQDAGYYQVVANVAPVGGTTNYYVYLANDADKTPISSLTYGNVIHINQKTIYDYPYINGSYHGYDIDYYYVADTSRSLVITGFGDNFDGYDVNSMVDVDSATTYYSANGSSYSTEASNTIDAGYYQTVFTWHLKDDYVTNYVLENGRLEKEWRIYPSTYALQTTNANGAGYIGWGANTDFNLYYWEETHDESALLAKLTMPDGIAASFVEYDTEPSKDSNGNWQTFSRSSGEYIFNFGLGDYLVWANFKIKDIDGSDNVTVTCDGNSIANPTNGIYTTSNFAHFEIVEKTPETLTFGTEQILNRAYFKYYEFTTNDTANEKYIVMFNIDELANNYDFGYGIHIRAEADNPKTNNSAYTELTNRTIWYGNTYYYTLDNLSANTSYVLRVGSWTSAYENITPTIKVMVFPKDLNFVYSNDIVRKSGETNEGAIVSAGTDVGAVVTIPYGVYIDVENSGVTQLTFENVYEIAANGFKDQTQITTLYLNANILNIGESAFAGCTNLTDIYFGSGYGNWNEDLIIGANVFAGCSVNLILHDSLGNSFYLNADGSLGDPVTE